MGRKNGDTKGGGKVSPRLHTDLREEVEARFRNYLP
jgi:hypothetical protein